MTVKLISVTPEAEKHILFVARVSSNDQTSESTKLLNYLIKNGHWSPFEHAVMTLEISTSRAIAQQILRHRSFTFQEFSQRYAVADTVVYTECREKGTTNRQSSTITKDVQLRKWWNNTQKEIFDAAFTKYRAALDKGIAPEVARFLLPLATATKLYMTGTLRSWIHYLGDGPGGRTNEHTQAEHREVAIEGKEIFCKEFPIIAEALEWTAEIQKQ